MDSDLVIVGLGAVFSVWLSREGGGAVPATALFITFPFALLGRLLEVCKDPESWVAIASL